MAWKAWLEGHQFDLEELATLFASGNTRVVREGEGYYLTSSLIDQRPKDVTYYEAAQEALQLVNGTGRAHNSSFQPVQLTGSYDDGSGTRQVVGVETAVARSRAMPVTLTIPGQPPAPPPPAPGPDYLRVAASNSDVAEALTIMGRPTPPNWVELYKVYEIIEHAGALQAAGQAAGISSNQLTLFRRTACHPDAAGPDARHGRSKEIPPKNPMDLGTAREIMGRLLAAWVDSLK